MDIHIEIDQLLLFLSIVVMGSAISWFWFKKGVKTGWDSAMFSLEEECIVSIDDETLEVKRVSDKQYHDFKRQTETP